MIYVPQRPRRRVRAGQIACFALFVLAISTRHSCGGADIVSRGDRSLTSLNTERIALDPRKANLAAILSDGAPLQNRRVFLSIWRLPSYRRVTLVSLGRIRVDSLLVTQGGYVVVAYSDRLQIGTQNSAFPNWFIRIWKISSDGSRRLVLVKQRDFGAGWGSVSLWVDSRKVLCSYVKQRSAVSWKRQCFLVNPMDASLRLLTETSLINAVDVRVSAESRSFAVQSGSNRLTLRRMTPGTKLFSLQFKSGIVGYGFIAQGKYVFCARGSGRIGVWQSQSGRKVASLFARDHWPDDAISAANGQLLLTSGYNNRSGRWNVCVWDLGRQRLVHRIQRDASAGLLDIDQKTVLIAGADGVQVIVSKWNLTRLEKPK